MTNRGRSPDQHGDVGTTGASVPAEPIASLGEADQAALLELAGDLGRMTARLVFQRLAERCCPEPEDESDAPRPATAKDRRP